MNIQKYTKPKIVAPILCAFLIGLTIFIFHYNSGSKEIRSASEAGDILIFADSQWRVLRVVGNKRLIVKEQPLTNTEIGNQGDFYREDYPNIAFVDFHTKETLESNNDAFFLSDSDDGYSHSKLKMVIDYYYKNTLASSADYEYILPASIPNPTFDEVKSQLENPDTATRLDYEYYTSHNDANLLTNASQSGNKQAFALSVSDIQAIEDNPKLLNFLEPNWFWLRSPGNIFSTGTSVIDGKLNIVTATGGGFPVRPALWVSVYPE